MANIKANDPKWIGFKNNKLTVIKPVYKNNRWLWLCKCECGNETIVYPNLMIRGKQKACHCGKSATFREMNTTHGQSKTRLYKIWCGMKKRCNNKNCEAYKMYGAAGINVCEEWETFLPFQEWALSHGYREDLTIDRIDYNKGYYPDNCRWTDYIEQARNRSSNKLITLNGETKTLIEWCEDFNINYNTAYSRISRGWTEEDAVTKPIIKQ